MNRPPLRLTRPGQLPAPATGDDSLQVLREAASSLARLRTPYWLGDSAVRLHALASLIAQPNSSCRRPSTTPAIRNSPGLRSANSSAPPPPQRHAATGATHDQLDNDHPHNAANRAAVIVAPAVPVAAASQCSADPGLATRARGGKRVRVRAAPSGSGRRGAVGRERPNGAVLACGEDGAVHDGWGAQRATCCGVGPDDQVVPQSVDPHPFHQPG